MNSGTLSCSDLCSIVEGHFSAAASIYSSKNSSEPELRDLVQREQDRFLCWAVEFEESDVLEGYFRYDKPALVSIRMTLENLGVALATCKLFYFILLNVPVPCRVSFGYLLTFIL